MLRIRIQLPRGQQQHYRYYDILHDALVNAWIAAGADATEVIGASALVWNFAALGKHYGKQGVVHTLVVSTPDEKLSAYLARFAVHQIRYVRASTDEWIDFSAAKIQVEEMPTLIEQPTEHNVGVFLLSPLAIHQRPQEQAQVGTQKRKQQRRWYRHLNELDLSAAINHRLSRFAQRTVALTVYADSLYVRANPDHAVLIKTKRLRNGKEIFVIGMQAPLLLIGRVEDLHLAWYAGIGEKTRNGFGCIGAIEFGVGR